MSKKHNKNRKNWKLYLILGSFALELLAFIIKKIKSIKFKDNFEKFKQEEKKEINELEKGEESLGDYFDDSKNIFVKYFIPHHSNNHKPKILHTSSLVSIAVVLLALKLSLTGYLFLVYPKGAQMSAEVIARVLQLTNQDREANSVSDLTVDPILSNSALDKANDILEKNYFAHYSPEGKRPWDFINRDDYRYIFVGENLAMNFTTAESVHRALMASPTHKKNILNDRYTEVGLAMVNGAIDGKNTNVLVELFATRVDARTTIAKDTSPTPTTPAIPVSDTGEVSVLGQENIELESTLEKPVAEKPQPIAVEEPIQEVKQLSPVENNASQKELPKLIPEITKKLALETDIVPALEALNQTRQVKSVPNTDSEGIVFTGQVVRATNIIFLSILAVMILSLFINIVVRIKIQHKSAIIQTLVLIIFIVGLLSVHFHYLENGLIDILLL